MRYKPVKVSSRIDPASLGIDTTNEELEKIKENTDEDGKINLGEVYNIPAPTDGAGKTIVKYLERDGLEYTESAYKKEYQLRATHQLMINGGSTAQIAQALSISLNEAKNLKRELAARQIHEIKNFNPQHEIAKAMMFYDHIAAKALQMANKTGKDSSMRSQIEALRVALQSQSDKQKFLALAGAYETGLRNGTGDNKHVDDAVAARDMLSAVLTGGTYEAVLDDDETDDGVELL